MAVIDGITGVRCALIAIVAHAIIRCIITRIGVFVTRIDGAIDIIGAIDGSTTLTGAADTELDTVAILSMIAFRVSGAGDLAFRGRPSCPIVLREERYRGIAIGAQIFIASLSKIGGNRSLASRGPTTDTPPTTGTILNGLGIDPSRCCVLTQRCGF